MRYFFLGMMVLLCLLLANVEWGASFNSEKPVFMMEDTIANHHKTSVELDFKSNYQPNAAERASLLADYQAIWAHLNHLYASGDVIAGKEYYTEDWFRHICSTGQTGKLQQLQRQDICHELTVLNWSTDGLVCTAKATVYFKYSDKNYQEQTRAEMVMVLLLQGDHWRIHALKIIKEQTI